MLDIHFFKSLISNPEAAKLEGVLKAMQLASKQGWSRVYVESDSLNLINCLSNGGTNSLHWLAKFLLKDITILSSCFSNISFAWAPRKADGIAHLVGKWAANSCRSVDVSFLPNAVLSLFDLGK